MTLECHEIRPYRISRTNTKFMRNKKGKLFENISLRGGKKLQAPHFLNYK